MNWEIKSQKLIMVKRKAVNRDLEPAVRITVNSEQLTMSNDKKD